MPYVLQNKSTSEIFSCTMINLYEIPFFGAKNWDFREDAEEEAPALLAAKQADPEEWELVEVDEHRLKLFNVKLANNPGLRLFTDSYGRAFTRPREV